MTRKRKDQKRVEAFKSSFFMFFFPVSSMEVASRWAPRWSGFIKEPFVSCASRQSENVIKFPLCRTFGYGLRGCMINLHRRDALNYAECRMQTAVDSTDGKVRGRNWDLGLYTCVSRVHPVPECGAAIKYSGSPAVTQSGYLSSSSARATFSKCTCSLWPSGASSTQWHVRLLL